MDIFLALLTHAWAAVERSGFVRSARSERLYKASGCCAAGSGAWQDRASSYDRSDSGFWMLGETGGYSVERLHSLRRSPAPAGAGALLPARRRYAQPRVVRLDWCPNAVVEALAAGVPVICSNHGGGAELVRDRGCVLALDTEEPRGCARCNHLSSHATAWSLPSTRHWSRAAGRACARPARGAGREYWKALQEVVSRGRLRSARRRSTPH